ncbi:MAG: XdhC family protein, partial [Anaerolineales bacterium]|nr:XdhC family protein [Anaerolineales bacterium]
MRDILSDVDRWQRDGEAIALATVIQTWGSSPRKVGSKMALTLDGKITGSVSGGCVENAVFEAGVESLKTKRPELLHFGVADETAWEVGLACGGSLDIFVNPFDMEIFQSLHSTWTNESQAVHVTVIRGSDEILGREMLILDNGDVRGSIGNEWNEAVLKICKEILAQGISRRVMLNDTVEVFLEAILPPPTLIIVGGVHIAIPLTSLAKMLGYRTILIDPRKAWGNQERFPHVDQLIQTWPEEAFGQIKINRSTAIAMLTHDPKLDDPALKISLSSSAFYVGALGSKTTHAKRRARLLNDGMSESQLSRLHAPIGLDIGAQSPEEIALAIMAEVVTAHRKQNQLSAEKEARPISN